MVMVIRKVDNGYVAEYRDEDSNESTTSVFETEYGSEEAEVEAFQRFLYHIDEMLGPSTSRYSAKRIYIRVEPGDKHPSHEDNIDG